MTSRAVTLVGYGVVAGAGLCWQLACVRRGGLTLGRFLRLVARSRGGRALLLVAWAWIGWHLFVRGTIR